MSSIIQDTNVEKALLAESINGPQSVKIRQEWRGINVYSLSDIMAVQGRGKNGDLVHGSVEVPMYALSVRDRTEMFARTPILQGVITGRAKRISGLNWQIVHKNKHEEETVTKLKEYKEIFTEYSGSRELKDIILCAKLKNAIQQEMPDVMDNLTNFSTALRRYTSKYTRSYINRADEITEWLSTPNIHDTFEQFLQKAVIDLMVHGALAVYKETLNKRIDNIYILPGGSVFPFRSTKVGGAHAFFQMIPGIDAKMYFSDEISFLSYIPNSWQSYGTIPIEALINKIAETLMFDKLSADRADGSSPPQKIVVFGQNASPFGGITSSGFDLPDQQEEQKRIESKLNELRMNAIVTLTGVGSPLVLDISKADTFVAQQTRQDKILRDIALIYNMSNMEVNLAGGEFTSGKETSEVQNEIEKEKGIKPILMSLTNMINREILPMRFGYDYEIKFTPESSESDRVALDSKKYASGSYDVNQIRVARGDDPYEESIYDRPMGEMRKPDGSEVNPINMRNM